MPYVWQKNTKVHLKECRLGEGHLTPDEGTSDGVLSNRRIHTEGTPYGMSPKGWMHNRRTLNGRKPNGKTYNKRTLEGCRLTYEKIPNRRTHTKSTPNKIVLILLIVCSLKYAR